MTNPALKPSSEGSNNRSIAVCTVAANNYLGRASVMAQSLFEHHPELPIYLGLTDVLAPGADLSREHFRFIELGEIGLADATALTFGLRREQLAVVAKPALMRTLLDRGYDTVIYLDPDLLITGELELLIEIATANAVTLTPHLADPASSAWERSILLSGTYNAGVIAISGAEGERFTKWWGERTARHPENDVAGGIYYDQLWLDLVPSIFAGVAVVKDRGVNVAYWNMAERPLRYQGEVLMAGQCPARIVHFSGFDSSQPEQASVHFGGVPADRLGPAAGPVFSKYARAVAEASARIGAGDTYRLGSFASGEPIPDIARLIYRELGREALTFGDPFDYSHPSGFVAWLNSPADGFGIEEPLVTRLWARIYQARTDVQSAFPNIERDDRAGFIEWTRAFGWREHGVGPLFQV